MLSTRVAGKRWRRRVVAAVAVLFMAALSLVAANPAQAAFPACYDNGHPEHRFVACVDGTSTEVWAWGQYDIRYYSNALLVLEALSPHGWGISTQTIVPYQTYIFVASMKTPVILRANLKKLGVVAVTACLEATENGATLVRCSPSQAI